jgi:predicted DNA-binding transcriptional regulator YafY
MLDTSVRLLRLASVLQSRSFWPGGELAERLEVTPRTLRRDIDRLRTLGYTIDATSGPGGGYRLGKGNALPPLMLDDDEAVALAVALRSAADSFAKVGETSIALLAKLELVLPTRLRRRLSAVQAMTVSLRSEAATLDPDLLTTIAAACRDHELLEVEPFRLAHTGSRRWYLLAWDRKRSDWRTFRVDRVRLATPLGLRFDPRDPPADVASYVTQSITQAQYDVRATVTLRGTLEDLGATVPSWCGRIEPTDHATTCLLHTGADSLDGLLCMLVLSGADVLAIDPPSMAPKLRTIMRRLSRVAKA